MTDHTENSLNAVITSLRDIVGPSVDPADPLAQQQLGLTLAYLDFLRSRLAYLPARDRFEVQHNVRLAEAALGVVGDAAPTDSQTLRSAVEEGRRLAETADATRDGLRHVAAVLAARISDLINSDLEDDIRLELELAVVTMSGERVDFDRSWYLPMGFDPEPSSVAPIEELLGH